MVDAPVPSCTNKQLCLARLAFLNCSFSLKIFSYQLAHVFIVGGYAAAFVLVQDSSAMPWHGTNQSTPLNNYNLYAKHLLAKTPFVDNS